VSHGQHPSGGGIANPGRRDMVDVPIARVVPWRVRIASTSASRVENWSSNAAKAA